ncbi:MAG: arginase, partial [Bacteroidetes bacterium]|nr:arginase [Bacteroidota bacterium]
MSDYLHIAEFLSPVQLHQLSHDEGFRDGQIGKMISVYEDEFPDLDDATIVLVGCGEQRGSGFYKTQSSAPDSIRR